MASDVHGKLPPQTPPQDSNVRAGRTVANRNNPLECFWSVSGTLHSGLRLLRDIGKVRMAQRHAYIPVAEFFIVAVLLCAAFGIVIHAMDATTRTPIMVRAAR